MQQQQQPCEQIGKLAVSWEDLVKFTSRHMTSKWRRTEVDATSVRRHLNLKCPLGTAEIIYFHVSRGSSEWWASGWVSEVAVQIFDGKPTQHRKKNRLKIEKPSDIRTDFCNLSFDGKPTQQRKKTLKATSLTQPLAHYSDDPRDVWWVGGGSRQALQPHSEQLWLCQDGQLT